MQLSHFLQPELLNGILASVKLSCDDTDSRKHREAAVVDLSFLDGQDSRVLWNMSKSIVESLMVLKYDTMIQHK